jgi:hypothetical protein
LVKITFERRGGEQMSSILKAFLNIVNNNKININTLKSGNNRANNMGDGLEAFIKDMFAGTINETNEQSKLSKFTQIYSYNGNKNNPPDLILKNSDAIKN